MPEKENGDREHDESDNGVFHLGKKLVISAFIIPLFLKRVMHIG